MFSLLDSNMEGIHRTSRTGREKGEGEIGVEEREEKSKHHSHPHPFETHVPLPPSNLYQWQIHAASCYAFNLVSITLEGGQCLKHVISMWLRKFRAEIPQWVLLVDQQQITFPPSLLSLSLHINFLALNESNTYNSGSAILGRITLHFLIFFFLMVEKNSMIFSKFASFYYWLYLFEIFL